MLAYLKGLQRPASLAELEQAFKGQNVAADLKQLVERGEIESDQFGSLSSVHSTFAWLPTQTFSISSKKETALPESKVEQEELKAQDEEKLCSELKARLQEQDAELLSLAGIEKDIAEKIDRLHRYNDVKDAGQMLLGKLAEFKNTTTRELYQQFGLDVAD
mmetsp:Transcript_16615/g.27465  ORF Transcript_16615/g.27465 Transcript_16615/m.27465 type:complete len:161 (+) Transcript_16615:51-533(+)